MDAVATLIDEARTRTGLDDFGPDGFREGLERLVHSLDREASLNAIGEAGFRAMLTGLLSQRLQVEDWYARHPEIDDEPIERPLVGLGLPRTGSTALSFLLAEDPEARSLVRWEAVEPCPPPSTVRGRDPRVARAEAEEAEIAKLTPRMRALVPSTPTGPMECQPLMGLDFKSHYFIAMAHLPSYADWLARDADLEPTYRYERRVLKLLQWGEPRRRPWRLKNPSHLLFLESFDRVFPDARFVMTHRDPSEVMVSVADVYATVAKRFCDEIDLHYLGALNVEQWSLGMDRTIAFREGGRDERFFDLDFRAVQRDPIGEVRRLYAWLGEPVTDAFEAGMERWWQENGEHRAANVYPDPSVYGLDLEAVKPRFATYRALMADWLATPTGG